MDVDEISHDTGAAVVYHNKQPWDKNLNLHNFSLKDATL